MKAYAIVDKTLKEEFQEALSRQKMSLWPITTSSIDPFYDRTFDFSGFTPMISQAPLGFDVANRFPRHVGSRYIMLLITKSYPNCGW